MEFLNNYKNEIDNLIEQIEITNTRQTSLMNSEEFSYYLRNYKISIIFEKSVTMLWKIGLLKADLIVSSEEIKQGGLKLINKKSNFVYIDNRKTKCFSNGITTLLLSPLPAKPMISSHMISLHAFTQSPHKIQAFSE